MDFSKILSTINNNTNKISLNDNDMNDILTLIRSPNFQCDDECQKNKEEEKLYKKYTAVKNNKTSSREDILKAEKEYYVFKYGLTWYNNFVEERESKNADDFINVLDSEINKEIKMTKLIINNYESNYERLKEISENNNNYLMKAGYFNYKKTNIENSKNIANRKNEYDVKTIMFYEIINKYIRYILWILFILFIYFVLIKNKEFNKKNIIIVVLVFAIILGIKPVSEYLVKIYEKYTVIDELELKVAEMKDL